MASWWWGGARSRAPAVSLPLSVAGPPPTLGSPMTSDEIRRTFLEFFESEGYLRLPSGPLVPAEFDPSALFTVAGMHPLKPYFQGIEKPPRNRVTSCQMRSEERRVGKE